MEERERRRNGRDGKIQNYRMIPETRAGGYDENKESRKRGMYMYNLIGENKFRNTWK